MVLKKVIGLDMQLPIGSSPAFYARIVKEIEEHAALLDRYEELWIVDSEAHLSAVIERLAPYRVAFERCELVWVASDRTEPGELYEDYAIVTGNGNIYFDLSLTALFGLSAAKPDAEPAPALLQLQEHLIGSFTSDGRTIYLIDRQLDSLADRIAKAYKCDIEWHKL
ncbi:hypothetical protein [Cohnella mopanensis]|uniref:hypothetical protein n=1 Tax=Cohnella mopanensis TaxID=2911966 RepID=UPI001EF8056E|nr:hypothetical protein [Cohnella mopanensis]